MDRTKLGIALAAMLALTSLVERRAWLFQEVGVPLAYAQNLAAGHGLRAWPGAPAFEGFDSPLWVAVLTVPAWLGVDGPTAAGLLSSALAVLAVVLTGVAYARVARGGAPAVAAALTMAVLPATARWGAAGLEHALFHALLAGLIVRRTHELRHRAAPWSIALALLLSLTRAEGGLYAVLVGLLLPYVVRDAPRDRAASARWWAAVLVAVCTPPLVRLALSGDALPHVTQLRLGWGGRGSSRLTLDGRGGRQLVDTAAVWAGPVALGAIALLASASRRVALLAAPLVALAVSVHVAFGGDWARGARWLALAGVPLALLAGAGIHALWRLPYPRLARPAALGLVVASWLAILRHDHQEGPETTLASVNRRVAYLQRVHASLQPGTPLTTADVDPGAFALAGIPVIDLSGMLDPGARPNPDDAAVRARLLDGERPTFVHLHGSPFHTLRPSEHPAWEREYVELPPYPAGRRPHVGTYVRRDALPPGPLPRHADAPQDVAAAD